MGLISFNSKIEDKYFSSPALFFLTDCLFQLKYPLIQLTSESFFPIFQKGPAPGKETGKQWDSMFEVIR